MDAFLPQLRDPARLGAAVNGIARAERLRGRLDERHFSSDMAPDLLDRSTRAALRAAGFAEDAVSDPSSPAARGYRDVLQLFLAHSDLPFVENQIKYAHSLLLRYDEAATTERRRYRGSAPSGLSGWTTGTPLEPARVPEEIGRLMSGTRELLESNGFHPLVTIAVFVGRFLAIRPFAVGNTRLAFALAVSLLDRYGYECVRQVSFEEVLDDSLPEGRLALAPLGAEPIDATPWVGFFLDAVAETEERALALSIQGPATGKLADARLHPRAERVLVAMRERGAAKIGELLPVLGTPRATLKKDLRALVDAGHLVSQGARKGTVYYVAAPEARQG